MVLISHGAVNHELVFSSLFVGLERENAVGTMLPSWHTVPHLIAEGSDFWNFGS